MGKGGLPHIPFRRIRSGIYVCDCPGITRVYFRKFVSDSCWGMLFPVTSGVTTAGKRLAVLAIVTADRTSSNRLFWQSASVKQVIELNHHACTSMFT